MTVDADDNLIVSNRAGGRRRHQHRTRWRRAGGRLQDRSRRNDTLEDDPRHARHRHRRGCRRRSRDGQPGRRWPYQRRVSRLHEPGSVRSLRRAARSERLARHPSAGGKRAAPAPGAPQPGARRQGPGRRMGRHVHSDQLCRRQPGRIRGRVHHRRRRRARHHANGDAVCASVVDDRALQSCHRRRSRAGRQRSGLCHHSGGELALTRERNLRQQARRPTDANLGSGDLTRFLRRRDRRGSSLRPATCSSPEAPSIPSARRPSARRTRSS